MEERILEQNSKRFELIESKISLAFSKIKEEMNSHDETMQKMRSYLKEWEGKTSEAWKNDESLRKKLEKQIDTFNEDISELKLALSTVRSIKNEVVVAKDLSKIEERIRVALREELKEVKGVIKENQKRISLLERALEKKEKSSSPSKKKANESLYSSKSSKKLPKSEETKDKSWSFSSNFDDEE